DVSAIGPVQGVQVQGQFSSDRLIVHRTPITNAKAAALLDTATGRLQVSRVSAEAFSGHLTGSSTIHTRETNSKSEVTAELAGFDPGQVARAVGSGIPFVP